MAGSLDRIAKYEMFLKIAYACALRSTCLRRRYGAVIVNKDDFIISTGYNGAPRRVDDCIKIGKCWREVNNIPSGQNYEKCMSVHAEMNALMQAGKEAKDGIMFLAGVDMKTGKLPDNMMPCSLCTKVLINSQIKQVVMLDSDITETPLRCKYITPFALWEIRKKEITSC